MLKYLKYILILATVVIVLPAFVSCGGKAEKSARISKLDSLQTALNQLESGLKEIDREQVKASYVSVKDNLQKLYVVFQKDPLIVQEELLVNYEKLKISLNRLVLDLDNAEKEIQFGLQQVEVWKESVKKGDVKTEEFSQYCQSETDAIRSLQMLISNKTKDWSTLQEQNKKFEPEVIKLVGK